MRSLPTITRVTSLVALLALRAMAQSAERPSLSLASDASRGESRRTDTTQATAKPVDGKAAKPNEGPAAVQIVVGSVTLNGLVQVWYTGAENDPTNTFRLRRTELKLVGELAPGVRWTLMADPAKALSTTTTYTDVNGTRVVADESVNQGSRILQDAFITLAEGRFAINAGQFKVPLTYEGGISSAKLEAVERPQFIMDRARGSFGDTRDLGVTVSGPITKAIDAQLGVFNGSGESMNATDKNAQKAIAGRVVVKTRIAGLKVGTSGIWGGTARADAPRHDRLAGELVYNAGNVVVLSEIGTAWDATVRRTGYSTLAGYHVGAAEGIVRYDVFDPDTHQESTAATARERDYLAGVTYSLAATAKLQLNCVRKNLGAFAPARTLFMMNLQTSW